MSIMNKGDSLENCCSIPERRIIFNYGSRCWRWREAKDVKIGKNLCFMSYKSEKTGVQNVQLYFLLIQPNRQWCHSLSLGALNKIKFGGQDEFKFFIVNSRICCTVFREKKLMKGNKKAPKLTKTYSRTSPVENHCWAQTTLPPTPKLSLILCCPWMSMLPFSAEENPHNASFFYS